MKYSFESLYLNRIWGKTMAKNPTSSKVMMNVGMRKEGLLKQDIFQSGVFEDIHIYGLTKSDCK